MAKKSFKLPKWGKVILWVLGVLVALILFSLIKPYISRQKLTALNLSLSIPSSWHYKINSTATGVFENLIISDISGINSMDQAIPSSAKVLITVSLAPKEKSLDIPLKYYASSLSSNSKVSYKNLKINGYTAEMATFDSTSTNEIFSREIMLYIDTGNNYFYRINGGVLRYISGVNVDYSFNLLKSVFDSISLNSKK